MGRLWTRGTSRSSSRATTSMRCRSPLRRARSRARLTLPSVSLRWIDSLRGRVDDFPNTWPIITRATYARLFIPEVLPEVDRVVYLDCDVLVRRDLGALFDSDMGTNWVLGSPDVQAPFVPFGVPH